MRAGYYCSGRSHDFFLQSREKTEREKGLMKKKLLCASAAFALTLNAVPMSLFAMEEMADESSILETQETEPKIVKTGMIGTCRWTIDSNGTLKFGAGEYHCEGPKRDTTTMEEYCKDFKWISDFSGQIKKVDGTAPLKISGDITGMFTGTVGFHNIDTAMKSVESIDLSGWDTSGVTRMEDLFCDCEAMTELNLSSWDMSSMEYYDSMLRNCTSLKKLDISGNFNFEPVYDNFFILDVYGFEYVESIEEIKFCADSYFIAKELLRPQRTKNWYVNDEGPIQWNDLPEKYSELVASIDTDHATLMREDVYESRTQKTSIDSAECNEVDNSYVYSGKAVEPKPRLVVNGETLVLGKDYTLSYENNDKPGEAKVIDTGTGKYTGTLTIPFTVKENQPPASDPVNPVDMYRLYNPNSGEHFYTASANEKNHLVSVGWKYEGTGWVAPSLSATPVYRLYNKNAGDHHYTMNQKERDHLVSVGWSSEGIGWYSDDAKTIPLYRQYNPNAKAGSHNYTTNKAENDHLVKIGWKGEGVGWYALEAGKPAPSDPAPAESDPFKLLAGTYKSTFNMDIYYILTVKEDGSYTLESGEWHIGDDFVRRTNPSNGAVWAKQTSTGKIELVSKTDANHLTFRIASMAGQYPLYQECPDGDQYYYYGNPTGMTTGTLLKFYSPQASDSPATENEYRGRAQLDIGPVGVYLIR